MGPPAPGLLSLPEDLLAAVCSWLPEADVLSVMSTTKPLFRQPGVAVLQASTGIARFERVSRQQHLPPGWHRDHGGRALAASKMRDALWELLAKFDARFARHGSWPALQSMRKRLHNAALHEGWLVQRLVEKRLVVLW